MPGLSQLFQRLGPPWKVRRQCIQVEERGDIGIPLLTQHRPERPQHLLASQRATQRVQEMLR